MVKTGIPDSVAVLFTGDLTGHTMDNKSNEATILQPCWPFWGLLSVVEKQFQAHVGLVAFTSTFEYTGVDCFNRFAWVGKKALTFLKRRNIDELISAAIAIDVEIQCFIDQYVEQETESYIKQLVTSGGWELGYLPKGSYGTERDIRWLLANWSAEWDDRPNLPLRDDINDLGALVEWIQSDLRDESDLVQLGLVEPEVHEFYAVLSLMTVCDAVHSNLPATLANGEFNELNVSQVKAIGIATIAAVETLAFAEISHLSERFDRAFDSKQPAMLAAALKAQISERASKAALKRHAKKDAARNFVINEWQKNNSAYNGNKTAFTRDYVRRVLNEFGIQVTEKTMREVWLKNTLSTSKEAG